MSKYTLSQLINRIIEVEEYTASSILESAKDDSPNILIDFINGVGERVRMLSEVKTNMVIEMTLEPITGIDINGYLETITSYRREAGPIQTIEILRHYITLYKKIMDKVYEVSIDLYNLLYRFIRDATRVLTELE